MNAPMAPSSLDSNQLLAKVVPLAAVGREALSLVGGKGANLGELIRLGLEVPPGFCVTTAAYQAVAARAGVDSLLEAMGGAPMDRLKALARQVRERLLASPIPEELSREIAAAYRVLGSEVAVAVRSSATAEDLPEASFAGQLETFLNVSGEDRVLQAVSRCWASLWTDRAVMYRASVGLDPRNMQIAVVVQRLVAARAAGVMFTANPMTGRRRQTVLEASFGLGEAVVSGAVTPDHLVVDTRTGVILERRLGDKRVTIEPGAGPGTRAVQRAGGAQEMSVTDEEARALATLGARVERHFGVPQDLEWAYDTGGKLWLLQTRPITTLFPLPVTAPESDEDLRVYVSGTRDEGVTRPITPMGLQACRLLASAFADLLWGFRLENRLAGPKEFVEAGSRPYCDATAVFRSDIGLRLLRAVAPSVDVYTAALLRTLEADPRLASRRTPLRQLAWIALGPLVRTHFLPAIVLAVWHPAAARAEGERLLARELAFGDVPRGASAHQRVKAVERLLFKGFRVLPEAAFPEMVAGYLALGAAEAVLGKAASKTELQEAMRGLPHNPTMEMDLALWTVAARLRRDAEAVQALREQSPTELAQAYRRGALPEPLQRGLAEFLRHYGHRGIAEIDLGLPRWSEDATHVLGMLANYLRLDDAARQPDARFRCATEQGEAMVRELSRRAGWRAPLARFLLGRARVLLGRRELWKFHFTALLARARALLGPVGEALAAAGRLAAADDIYFVGLAEVREGLAGVDLRPRVQARRDLYRRELNRRQIPAVLLSDGTEPAFEAEATAVADADGILRGIAASPGRVTARARVVRDPTGARLEPGEILVAPSTDPGWTPLFLTAGGLVMQVGGNISHGAVIAREYGIPAVVGVASATERIVTGQVITVDGTRGLVSLGPVEASAPALAGAR